MQKNHNQVLSQLLSTDLIYFPCVCVFVCLILYSFITVWVHVSTTAIKILDSW